MESEYKCCWWCSLVLWFLLFLLIPWTIQFEVQSGHIQYVYILYSFLVLHYQYYYQCFPLWMYFSLRNGSTVKSLHQCFMFMVGISARNKGHTIFLNSAVMLIEHVDTCSDFSQSFELLRNSTSTSYITQPAHVHYYVLYSHGLSICL